MEDAFLYQSELEEEVFHFFILISVWFNKKILVLKGFNLAWIKFRKGILLIGCRYIVIYKI